jgi:small subunit ribosomal protein S27Ae
MADEKKQAKQQKKVKPYKPGRMCPKCGARLGEHENRLSCGKCGYTEFKAKK